MRKWSFEVHDGYPLLLSLNTPDPVNLVGPPPCVDVSSREFKARLRDNDAGRIGKWEDHKFLHLPYDPRVDVPGAAPHQQFDQLGPDDFMQGCLDAMEMGRDPGHSGPP